MQDENIATLDVATNDVHEGVALILDAAVTSFSPGDTQSLEGVAVALGALLKFDGPPARDVIARAFHRAGMFDEGRLDHAVDHAAMAFWSQFAACYPEVSTGDLDADTDATLFGAMRAAAKTWLETNS